MAARTVRMPAHSTRADTIEATVMSSPPAAREANDTQPTSSANPACRATIRRARAPVRQVGPHETQHVGKGRGAAHQRHGEIDHEARRDPGKVLLDQYRRGGALDQPEREAQKSPGENLAAEDAFRERAGSDDTALGHSGSLIARGRARILTR